ncbi:hypothetical protein KOR34_52290 [Posidoniimonas corsicana]|uniref:Uncharacterized protein n=1 Tax=Posidoniimonas corsicana TaxID=1938618 RepID=A0A5C5UTX4_9BACT|nr:hypothetical protein [Posidoniimonas corsicana]TWT29319.1 hypothetical protein KOR34_52290 [Posidoniimonas corsicana]
MSSRTLPAPAETPPARRGTFDAKASRVRRVEIQASHNLLERNHGAALDAMEAAERDRLALYVFGSEESVRLGRQHAPDLYRIALLSALATGKQP